MPNFQQMLKYVESFNADTSRSARETKDGLEMLRDEIDVMIDAIEVGDDEGEDE